MEVGVHEVNIRLVCLAGRGRLSFLPLELLLTLHNLVVLVNHLDLLVEAEVAFQQ